MEKNCRYVVVVLTSGSGASVGTDHVEEVCRRAERHGYKPEIIELDVWSHVSEENTELHGTIIKSKSKKFSIKKINYQLVRLDRFANYAVWRHIQCLFFPLFTWISKKIHWKESAFIKTTTKITDNDQILIVGITPENFARCIFFVDHITSKKKRHISLLFDETFRLDQNFSSQLAKYIFEKLSFQGKCLSYTGCGPFKEYFISEFALPIRDDGQLLGAAERWQESLQTDETENACHEILQARPLIFYSLKNLSSANTGSSLRLYLLVRYLRENFCKVSVCIQRQKTELLCEHIYSYEFSESLIDKIAFGLERIQQKLSLSKYNDIIQFLFYIRNRNNRDLRRKLSLGLSGSNSLFVEHVLYLDVVRPLANLAGVPIFVTLYDDDSNRCYLSAIKNFVKRLTIARLRKVDAVATVAKNEHDMLEDHGIENYLIPSTADILAFDSKDVSYEKPESSDEYSILFVGSYYYPNLEAKKIIFELAKKARDKKYPWKFVIVGGCAAPDESYKNVKVYGIVSQEQLAKVYFRSSLIISPLISGVGASVKTIEGMGTGKPFLGTSITFRGLDVHDGQDCFIEDNIDNYISRIYAIYTDQERAKSVGLRGKILAQQYDFRNIFSPYLAFARSSM